MNQTAQSKKNNFASPSSKTPRRRRVAPIIIGSSLALLGLSRRSKSGLALAVAGGAFAYLGSRPRSQDQSALHGSVLINTSPQEAYDAYRKFEAAPVFMSRVQSVTKMGEGLYRWKAQGPLGIPIQWDTEIIDEQAGETISWRSVPDSDLDLEGTVLFEDAGDRGTLVTSITRFESPGGKLTLGRLKRAASKLFSNLLVQQDLRRFKALIETGEIATIDGQTHGPRSALTAALHLADPHQPAKRDTQMSEVFNAKRRMA